MSLTADYELEDALQSARKAGRDKVLDELTRWIKEYQSGRDSAYMEVVLTPVLEKIRELRAGEP